MAWRAGWHSFCNREFEPDKMLATSNPTLFRRTTMTRLTINDLSRANDLDAADMAAVSGGSGYCMPLPCYGMPTVKFTTLCPCVSDWVASRENVDGS